MSEKKSTKQAKEPKQPKQPKGKSESDKLDTAAIADAPILGGADVVLGTLSADAPQSESSADKPKAETRAQTPKKSMRKPEASATSDAPKKQQAPTAELETAPPSAPAVLGIEPDTLPEPFRLPRSAFVGIRKSGGLNFNSREVVVYPDGRVAYDARGVPQKEYTRLRRVMNDAQVISLRKLLDSTGFWVAQTEGKQNPDAFAYEIAARLGQRSNEMEVFDGSVPEKLQPLLERLVKLLPQD